MDPQNGMFPQPQSSSKLGVWLVAILAVVIIGGVIWLAWPKNTETPVATTTTPSTADAVVAAPATITTALSDIDTTLISMDKDIASIDDNAPTL